jgi:hypothetical protein
MCGTASSAFNEKQTNAIINGQSIRGEADPERESERGNLVRQLPRPTNEARLIYAQMASHILLIVPRLPAQNRPRRHFTTFLFTSRRRGSGMSLGESAISESARPRSFVTLRH